jgi:hypothetical protein
MSLNAIKRLVSVLEEQSVYCEVRTKFLYVIYVTFLFQRLILVVQKSHLVIWEQRVTEK